MNPRTRNIIIVVTAVVVAGAIASYFGFRGCDCNCKGSSDKVKKSDKDGKTKQDLVKTVENLEKQVKNLKQEAADREERLDALESCLKYTCRKHKPRKRVRIKRKRLKLRDLPSDDGGGDSHTDNDCRVIKVVGHTVYTKGCAGWTPLQFGPKHGKKACPGIYARSLRKRGAYHVFTLSQLRMEQNCRGYQLRKGSKWLVITGGSEMPARRVYAKVLTPGEGYAYYMR